MNDTSSQAHINPALDKATGAGANALARHRRARKAPMFGLIRTPILLIIAFVAGLMYERSNAADACAGAGGRMHDGICWNE